MAPFETGALTSPLKVHDPFLGTCAGTGLNEASSWCVSRPSKVLRHPGAEAEPMTPSQRQLSHRTSKRATHGAILIDIVVEKV